MSRIWSPFSALALPLRLLGLAIFIYAAVQMLVAPVLGLIAVALAGSLLWQAAGVAERYSPLYRKLEAGAVGEVMRADPVEVGSWLSIARFRKQHPDLGPSAFVITKQDSSNAGVFTPEQVESLPDEAARYSSLAELAHPISHLHKLRPDDSALEAFAALRRRKHVLLPVLDEREALVGVVTRQDLDRWVNGDGPTERSVIEFPAKPRAAAGQQKLAA